MATVGRLPKGNVVREQDEIDYSRVRCEDFWYEVIEPPDEVAELLDHGDDDWVELSGRPDGRPIWLQASSVDYVEGASSASDITDAVLWELLMGLLRENPEARWPSPTGPRRSRESRSGRRSRSANRRRSHRSRRSAS